MTCPDVFFPLNVIMSAALKPAIHNAPCVVPLIQRVTSCLPSFASLLPARLVTTVRLHWGKLCDSDQTPGV